MVWKIISKTENITPVDASLVIFGIWNMWTLSRQAKAMMKPNFYNWTVMYRVQTCAVLQNKVFILWQLFWFVPRCSHVPALHPHPPAVAMAALLVWWICTTRLGLYLHLCFHLCDGSIYTSRLHLYDVQVHVLDDSELVSYFCPNDNLQHIKVVRKYSWRIDNDIKIKKRL